MKATELMDGDWVLDWKKPAQITGIMCDDLFETTLSPSVSGEYISPIPLTEEILEKNGFKECTNGDWTNDNVDFILHRRKDGIFRIQNTNMTLPYVSSFQHALRLCEIDKEVEL